MGRGKPPTPQELYRSKKQKEEQEKIAYLPPGLINHGNTCFMNSVLQGLIATSLLSDLVQFKPIPEATKRHTTTLLASKRSPQLCNGHEVGGEYEQKWVNEMPLGDKFLGIMFKAWDLQNRRQKESLSPRPILNILGRKYEQYLDFAQQDAHEFMRILLDAMRMEEIDVIKKRQPPPEKSKSKKRRRMTITPASFSPSEEIRDPLDIPEEEKLMSMVDMIFGGKLTSILVCQKCKHISQTYEDFNDLSLSIKAEDYAKERKRDRLKNFAKKLTSFTTTTNTPSTSIITTTPLPSDVPLASTRSSSVPPPTSPRERNSEPTFGEGIVEASDEPRRKSFELPESTHEQSESVDATPSSATLPETEEKKVEFIDPTKPTKSDKKTKGKKDLTEDPWTKLGRRISMTVGLGKTGKDGEREGRSRRRKSKDLSATSTSAEKRDMPPQALASAGSTPRASMSSEVQAPSVETDLSSSLPALPQQSTIRESLSRSSSRPRSLQLPQHASSPLITTAQRLRSKSPKPPKPSRAETEYLRHLLADIPPSSAHPLNFFRPVTIASSSKPSGLASSSQNWLKPVGQLQSIEECLRMFTSVEILDKENLVGCRTCWKIANGLYKPRHQINPDDEEDDDDEDEEQASPDIGSVEKIAKRLSVSAPTTPSEEPNLPLSLSTPNMFVFSQSRSTVTSNDSVSSLPSTITTSTSDSALDSGSQSAAILSVDGVDSRPTTPGGLPIPLISTTSPDGSTEDAPSSSKSSGVLLMSITSKNLESEIAEAMSEEQSSTSSTDESETETAPTSFDTHIDDTQQPQDSEHLLPAKTHLRHPSSHSSSDIESGDESSGSDTDTSATATSTGDTGEGSANDSAADQDAKPQQKKASKPKKPKPVVMNPAYKRYLIAVPPPVLVIHLKRFQQISKSAVMSFSSGFKKLDDYVTFPEYLDLTPFLAPKKEDFGLGKKRKHQLNGLKRKDKESERCMYRLYAVVVHIGSMLGGHYIAYVALPSQPQATEPSSRPGTPTQDDAVSQVERQWAYISDTVVRLTTKEEVLKAKAYICMYERI